jgi:hypothetical protein
VSPVGAFVRIIKDPPVHIDKREPALAALQIFSFWHSIKTANSSRRKFSAHLCYFINQAINATFLSFNNSIVPSHGLPWSKNHGDVF